MVSDDRATALENPPNKGPLTRGISSKKALWFEYGKLPVSVGSSVRWEAEDVLQLVFPPHVQKAQYEIALKLIKHLAREDSLDGDALASWAASEGVPNSTLRNLVIPKLIRTGMLARERKNPTGLEHKDKRHSMILRLSTRFGEAFKHVGGEWISLVETWKSKKRVHEAREIS